MKTGTSWAQAGKELVLLLGLLGAGAACFLTFVMFSVVFLSNEPVDLKSGRDMVTFLVFTVALAGTFRLLLWFRQKSRTAALPAYHGRIEQPEQFAYLVEALRLRASRLRRASNVILTLIVLSVLAGFRIFTTAGAISSRDEYSLQREFVRNQLDGLREIRSYAERFAESHVDAEDLKRRLDKLDTTIREEFSSLQPSASSPSFVWSTISTRVTSVFLLLFLIQILVTMYRYSIRLASFYEGRADTLQLLAPSLAFQFTDLVAAFSTESLDFGKAPKTPVQHAVELAKELVRSGSVGHTKVGGSGE